MHPTLSTLHTVYSPKSSCRWVYGGPGQYLTCKAGEAVTGTCGSYNTKACNSNGFQPGGPFSHGIYCCYLQWLD